MMSYLNDDFLIRETNILKIPYKFLTKKTYVQIKKFFQNLKSSMRDPNLLNQLWGALLSDAITFLKMNDKREFRNSKKPSSQRDEIAFGIDKLSEYFQEFSSFEALLYGADGFYRDHIMHVFRVWLIGHWIMNQFKSDVYFDCINIMNKEENPLSISKEETEAMWCIIALTHDLGYPLDKVDKISQKIDSMMAYFGRTESNRGCFQIPTHHHFINDFILKFISSKLTQKDNHLQTTLQSKFYLKFSRSFENFDHGIISCIVLMKNLVYFLESDLDLGGRFFTDFEDARQFFIRRDIMRSVASHTCTDIYHLYPNSLSFILILADELQVWGRPTFIEMKGGGQKPQVNARLAKISKEEIKMEFIIKNGTPIGIEQYIFSLYRRWHKLLRTALDASERKIIFTFTAEVDLKNKPSNKYSFSSKHSNEIQLLINNEKQPLSKIYP